MKNLTAVLLFLFCSQLVNAQISVENLSVESLKNPIGIEDARPRLSWQLKGEGKGIDQYSYQILVASSADLLLSGKADLWDSGEVISNKSLDVIYQGKSLLSKQICYWTVVVRDNKKSLLKTSRDQHFWEMGILKKTEWEANWIKAPKIANWMLFAAAREESWKDSVIFCAPYFRKEFVTDKKIERARLYISGIGYNVTYINGYKVGDQVLDPAFTRYDKSVLYRVFDVTALLKSGNNAIGAILGNGWYNMPSRSVWGFDQANWKSQPELLAQLEITYQDGTLKRVVSDNSWKTVPGPIYFNSVYQGEFYDARKEMPLWNKAGYDDAKWVDVLPSDGPSGRLKSQIMPPIREIYEIEPVTVNEPSKGRYVLDFGKNITGYVRLKLSLPAGTMVQVVYGERLTEDGHVDQSHIAMYSLDKPFQTDRYIANGNGEEIWSPHFTYHGFQYMEVTGLKEIPKKGTINTVVVHTDFETKGNFSSSNLLFNKILANAQNSYLTNFHGYPTDCPHREKNGWTGDAHLVSEMALMNFDASLGYKKWIADIIEEQRPSGEIPGIVPTPGWGYFFGNGPAWDCSLFLVPWYIYTYNGDISVIEMAYPSIKRYIDFLQTRADSNQIVTWGLGDWCPANTETPSDITSTAYYYKGTELLSKMANLLGHAGDAKKYRDLAHVIKQSFNTHFYKGNGIYGTGSQTALSCAIYQGLATANLQETLAALVDKVKDSNYHLDCGILGTKYLLHALLDNGYPDVAYKIINQRTYPSWGHWVEQGATTLWEKWDGTNSRNHPMFGDVGNWFYKALGGLNYDELNPGFKQVVLKPYFSEDVNWVDASHESRYGKVRVDWTRKNNKIVLKLDIPHNSQATILLPLSNVKNIRENGKSISGSPFVKQIGAESGNIKLQLCSGNYVFDFTPDIKSR